MGGSANVFLFTNAKDEHATFLEEKAADRGIQLFRCNTEEFPDEWSVELSGDWTTQIITKDNRVLPLRSCDGVFYRRAEPPAYPHVQNPELRQWCSAEASEAWRSVVLSSEARFLFHPWRSRLSSDKLWQLKAAEGVGLDIPATVVASRRQPVIKFMSEHKSVVYKPWKQMFIDVDGITRGIYTSRLDAALVNQPGALDLVPGIYQQEIEKSYELRATIVGPDIFCCQILSQESPRAKVDWRRYDFANTPHRPYQLSEVEKARLLALMSRLRLEFGCVDLIRDTAGRLVFLEVNTNGQWLWLEHLTGLPISDAVVQWLARPATAES